MTIFTLYSDILKVSYGWPLWMSLSIRDAPM
ncbi:hypothetical protein [Shigella phage ESh6]|nr:hypothetical protein [Shigella phage ESh6]